MKQSKAKQNITRLKHQLKGEGIVFRAVAERVGCRVPHVCNVLAGRTVSRPVVTAAKALLAEAKARKAGVAA